jgi:hypothetical protein
MSEKLERMRDAGVCVCVFKFPAGTQTCYKPICILLCSIIKQMPIQFLF